MEDQEVIKEFLIESSENLARLDQEMVELEQRPKDTQLLASVFRTIHTIKGTCGFLGFTTLEAITHRAEDILSQLRDGKLELNAGLVTLILEAVDATRKVLSRIESTGEEGTEPFESLRQRLEAARTHRPVKAADAPAAPAVPASNPTPQPGAEESESAARASAASDSTIRVDVGLLDKLMNLVGELVLTRNQILEFNAQQEEAGLNATSQRLNLITTELQEGVMKTRMQPIGVIWNKLPRVVRDMATSFGKQIELEMDGADTELDKTIIEAIKDPLTHIVRNCCDHGIEKPDARVRAGKAPQGKLTLRAFHEGGQVNIEISDDGAGIDTQRLKAKALQKGDIRPEQAERMSEREALGLIFLPGLSTAAQVTNVSGRGVGMDVVKTNVEKIGGLVDLVSRPDEGTTVRLKIPLTLAIIPGLVVTSGGERFVIPQVSLLELIRLEGDSGKQQIEWIHGTPVYRRRGKLLPIAYLNRVLECESAEPSDVVNIVVLQAEDRQFGLVVDGISDTQEIVVKPLGKQLKSVSCYAGATIMGDGRVALILDVLGIGQMSKVLQESREQSRAEAEHAEHAHTDRQTFLLFRAGPFERLSVPLSLVARLEEFPQAKIERAAGKQVAQYRGQILPLASLGAILEPGSADSAGERDPGQVVVFDDGGHRIGILVDQILDIAEETISIRQTSQRRGLLGSAVIAKKVTDLVDLRFVIQTASEDWFGRRGGGPGNDATVLLAEGSAFSRGLARNTLEMAGYRVVEGADTAEVLRELEQRKVDVVIAALDLPGGGGYDLLTRMRSAPSLSGIPVLGLANTAEEAGVRGKHAPEFEDCQVKFDLDAVVRSVANLAASVRAQEAGPVPVGKKE